jgi:TAT (twin-arginine translocation) pathway signal sequence
MCDDQAGLSRRTFIQGTAVVGAAAAAGVPRGLAPRLPLRSPARAVTADGTSAYSMAMHIHSSFSEQNGSMDTHLYQAAKNAVDVCWWTDHDHRMDALYYRKVTHFTSFSERGATGQGGAWNWRVAASGPNTSAFTGAIVSTPCSPHDPVTGGALHLVAQSSGTSPAKYGYFADCQPAGWNYRDNLTGQSLLLDVLLASGWSRGYLELLVTTSYHPASGGRPAGNYTLSYRFTPGGSASAWAYGNNGVIRVPVTSPWQTVTLTPSSDIAKLWPDLDYRDFAMWQLNLSAVSTGDKVVGYFDYLRFNRTIAGQAQFSEQAAMGAALAARYPSVTQRQGLEVSLLLPHLNWFGPNITVPGYAGITSSTYQAYLKNTVIPHIHTSGGLASYNHPYGYGSPPALSQSQQNTLLSQTASTLLANRVLGADLLEVGYKLRQGVDVNHHLGLWDVLSRNAVFLTGNGVSDDHAGTNWYGFGNNWVTSVWARSTGMPDLLSALAAGRAWCGSLSKFRGSLDLLVDGSVPMGAVSVSSVSSRQLTATATGLPSGAVLQVLQGAVDYAGQNAPADDVTLIGSYTTSQLVSGHITRSVSTTQDSFLRTQLVSSTGAIIATSNPVWLLRKPPPNGIPAARAA